MSDKMKLGIVGCGNISKAYFNGASLFEILEVTACADLNEEAARAKADEFGARALSVDQLMEDDDVDIVVNLTIPQAHAMVSLKALEAGKHVHCEKPLAVTLEDGKRVIDMAKAKGLRVGCAPDTFLGGGQQTCRKLLDDGWIGRPIGGTAFLQTRGPEGWHPNPAFFYEIGGGPVFDMGPYYITALINLLGPVKSVIAFATKSFEERTATCAEHFGEKLPVHIPTHNVGALQFGNGAVISASFSFDVPAHTHRPLELYGSEGSLQIPDPNTFGGEVKVKRLGGGDWQALPHSHIYTENSRSIGVADMAYAIREGRPHRCSGELAYHALEVMHAFEKSQTSGQRVDLESACLQPEALPLNVIKGRL